MAMTAPGMGSFSGTASWRKTFRDSQAQRLRLVLAKAGIGKKLPVVHEISAQNLRDAEDKMAVGDLFEDIHAQPFSELHHALLMTRGAEVAALAREGQEIFMAAVFTFVKGDFAIFMLRICS